MRDFEPAARHNGERWALSSTCIDYVFSGSVRGMTCDTVMTTLFQLCTFSSV